ncbi:MAG: histidine phosphatase family protein [Alcanivorax sp.]
MVPAKHFYMIRHGETTANKARKMAGSLDSPLTDFGREQAAHVQNIVADLEIKPKAIVHSNLSRARDTASIINQALNVPMHEEADLAELHAGDWEGVPYDECQDLLTGWPDPPNGETFSEFCARIRNGKTKALSQHDTPVLIVSHGGVFRAFGGVYGLKTPGIFRNCHLYEFQPDPSNDIFPWKVWSYDYESKVERVSVDVYHLSERMEITDQVAE